MEENKFKLWLRQHTPDQLKSFHRAIECEMVKQNYISNTEIFKRTFCDDCATTLKDEIARIIQVFFNSQI